MNQAVIGVGSNINAEENIKRAIAMIRDGHELMAESEWTWTKPIGSEDQPDFLNGAVLILTSFDKK